MTRSGGKNERGFRPDIEGLRAIAVLLVLVYHAGLLSDAPLQARGGFLGVDLFFVISGFLITGLLLGERRKNGRIGFAQFYARRVRRILPAAAVVLVVTLSTAFVLVGLVQRAAVMQDGTAAALSIANIRFALTTDYFSPTSYSPFLHFWSLGVEEQFYFIWPAVLALASWRSWRVGPSVALALIAVASLAASLLVTDANPSWAFYMLPTRAWQLASGGLLATALAWQAGGSSTRAADSGDGAAPRVPGRHTVRTIHPPAWIRTLGPSGGALLGWMALGLLLWDALTLDFATTPYPGAAAVRPTLCGVVLLATGTLRLGPALLLDLLPLRFIGRISYSLYLWHWPLLILGGLVFSGQVQRPLTVPQAIFLGGLSIPVAALSWRFVEEPFRKGQPPFALSAALPSARVVAAGVSAMLVLAILGSALDVHARSALDSLDNGTPAPSGLPASSLSYAVTAALRPSVGTAPVDFEQTVADGCLKDWGVKQATDGCVYGRTDGRYRVVLIGDSHASALFPAVEEVAKAHGWRLQVYLKRGCPFIDMRLYASTLKREYVECQTWNASVIEHLRNRPPDLILISQLRWIAPVDSALGNDAAKGQAMAREIEETPASSRKVILEDPPLPGPGRIVPECLSAHLDDYRLCAFPRAVGFDGVGVKERIASQATGASLVDLSSRICPGTGVCPVVIDGMIVWRDSGHLTATFAASLAPALDGMLTDVVNASGDSTRTPAQGAREAERAALS